MSRPSRSTRRWTAGGGLLGLAALGACTLPPPVPGPETGQSAQALVGLRNLERAADWAPNQDLPSVALEYQVGPPESAWRWDVGLRYAADQARRSVAGVVQDLETHLVDLSVGGRWLVPTGWRGFQPYLGAGAALLWAQSDVRRGAVVIQDQDGGLGAYARVGFWLDFQPHEHLGLDLMVIRAGAADLAGEARGSDSWTLALVFGYRY